MTARPSKKCAIKGTVAAAAGVAVLLGGMGTFAPWNQNGSIGTEKTGTGHLTAEFPKSMTWTDATGSDQTAHHTIGDISEFRMVPGDVLVGTYDTPVSLEGENLSATDALDVGASQDGTNGNLPAGVTVVVAPREEYEPAEPAEPAQPAEPEPEPQPAEPEPQPQPAEPEPEPEPEPQPEPEEPENPFNPFFPITYDLEATVALTFNETLTGAGCASLQMNQTIDPSQTEIALQ